MATSFPGPGFGSHRSFALVLALVAVACGPAPEPPQSIVLPQGWREFEGSWSASGSRSTMRIGADRRISIVDLSGTLLLSGPQRPGVGFRAEVLALNDSATGMVGRAVWTDEHGDQVWSELKGQGTATGNHVDGTIIGGTGRYALAEGTYELSWQYVLEAEDGTVQGRAVGLKGRVRASTAPAARGPQR